MFSGSKGFVAPVNGFATTSSGAAPPAMSMMPTMPTQQGTMGFGFIPQAGKLNNIVMT